MNAEHPPQTDPAEEEALRIAVSRWMDELPVVAAPARPRAPVRPVIAAAGVLVLIAATILLAVFFFEADDGALTLPVTPAPAPGAFAPPTLSQVLMITGKVAEVRVTEAAAGKLAAELIEVVHGDPKGVPARIELIVPHAVSELEAEVVKAKPDDLLLLLLREKDGKLALSTGNPWSIVSARSTSFLWTFDLHGKPYAERRAMVLATLRLRDLLRKTKWEEQAPHLVAAISSTDPVRREFAMEWYSMHRTGWPSSEMSLVPEEQQKKPALVTVDLALLPLLPPRKDAISTMTGTAAGLLALHPAKRWAPELANPTRAEAVVLLFHEMASSYKHESRRQEIEEALLGVTKGRNPTAAYLAATLLGQKEQARNAKLDEAARKALTGWEHVPAWPPQRLLTWLGQED